MKLVRLRLGNFRSFSAGNTELDLDDLTFFLGPNGAGKTAILQALARMFSLDPAQRNVKKSDFTSLMTRSRRKHRRSGNYGSKPILSSPNFWAKGAARRRPRFPVILATCS
jgi:recombinational DNA repair ATPase RecF